MIDEKKYPFTNEEWENCLKVLITLKDDPLLNPDNKLFGTLITKIHKKFKKGRNKEIEKNKKQTDLEINLKSTLSQIAINEKALFRDNIFIEKNDFTKLEFSKNCYCCNKSYDFAHSFYSRLCEDCSEENYQKRFQNVCLKDRNIILTGGRVKVGYATALRLLQNQANLVITTRFPAIALEQFQKEPDFKDWQDRLIVYGLDLRNIQEIAEFIKFYKSKFSSLNILINNAAQTIKYPNEYYLPILKKEQKILEILNQNQNLIENKTPVLEKMNALNQAYLENSNIKLNRFDQPVDNREKTSWNSTLEEISLHELIEVNLINQIAPFFLIKELKPLLENSNFEEKFIINVTSSEGIFNHSNKTYFHPHTNMTKASLNMMTLTSAKEFSKKNIFMSCVDVGWISTGATENLRKKQFDQGYIPPLDPVDGASRILDPIIKGINKNPVFGVLLKNYKTTPW